MIWRADSAHISYFLDCRRWPFQKQKTAYFKGSAGFEETKTLFLVESALRNPFVRGTVPPRCILHLVHLEALTY